MPRGKRRMQTQYEVNWTLAVGRRLRKARDDHGYSQADFAEKIDVPSSVLSSAENGRQALPLYAFFRACVILGKCANSMMGRKKKGGV